MSIDPNIVTGLVFAGYLAIVFALTLVSGRFLEKPKSFVSEYFLGSQRMGGWVLALSFAATCASGGSFAGFPSLIYTHGWILFLWIGSYMIFPLFGMGLMGKRLNGIAHRTHAVTVPDILRDRFESTRLGVFSSIAIVIFLTVNLIAQFKSGGLILHVMLDGTPGYESVILPAVESIPVLGDVAKTQGTGYVFSLILFAVVTVVYTSYGGFRAVVWTDVLQGIIMLVGVMIMLPTILYAAGGLPKVTRTLAEMPTSLTIGVEARDNGIEYIALDRSLRLAIEHRPADEKGPTWVELIDTERPPRMAVHLRRGESGPVATASEVAGAVLDHAEASKLVDVRLWGKPESVGEGLAEVTRGIRMLQPPTFAFGPSHRADGMPFHPLGMAISFFILWTFSGAGHPGFLTRLMAFRNTRELRYSIVTVTGYFTLVYIPLVLIFVASRTLIHPAQLTEGSDSIMPTVAKTLVHPLLAGLLLAAPFSAVMSTVDSFLLVISSSIVRDIYQRTIHPSASEPAIKRGTYLTTALVGVLATLLSIDPPAFLQDVVVFASSGIAATFLVALGLGIYWKGMTTVGAWAAMLSGFLVVIGCHLPLLFQRFGLIERGETIVPLGLDPFVWGCVVSLVLGVVVSWMSPRSSRGVIQTYFGRRGGVDAEG